MSSTGWESQFIPIKFYFMRHNFKLRFYEKQITKAFNQILFSSGILLPSLAIFQKGLLLKGSNGHQTKRNKQFLIAYHNIL